MLSVQLLQLLRLVSPSLPIGGFAYSQGLEYAIESGWVTDAKALEEWLAGVASESVGRTDAPVIFRFYRGLDAADKQMLEQWNQWLKANRESHELLFEDEQLGMALKRLLKTADALPNETLLPKKAGYSCLFAYAAHHYQIPAQEAVLGYLWSWLDNQIMVACKTLPLGQTAAQKLMIALLPVLEGIAEEASTMPDTELGGTLPSFAIASALHETQYSRLFRS